MRRIVGSVRWRIWERIAHAAVCPRAVLSSHEQHVELHRHEHTRQAWLDWSYDANDVARDIGRDCYAGRHPAILADDNCGAGRRWLAAGPSRPAYAQRAFLIGVHHIRPPSVR